jgi:hypothetical protein
MTALPHNGRITTSHLFWQGNLDQLIAVRSTNAMVSGAGRFVTVTVDNEGLHNSYIPRNGNGTDSISELSPSVSGVSIFVCVDDTATSERLSGSWVLKFLECRIISEKGRQISTFAPALNSIVGTSYIIWCHSP